MKRAPALAAVLVCFLCAFAAAGQPLPIGPEFGVNTATVQHVQSVASDSAGNFVIVWTESAGLIGQRFDASAGLLGSRFRVDDPSAIGYAPSVSRNLSGFVVVWQAFDGDDKGVFGQRFDGAGNALGGRFRVNTYTTLKQAYPNVSLDPDTGGFVVAWDDARDGNQDVYAQRYAVSGVPVDPEFRVNTHTSGSQSSGAVAFSRFGSFVVVWQGEGDSDAGGIFAQRFRASGVPVDPEFRVNTTTSGTQSIPSVAIDSLQRFVVAWKDASADSGDIRAQRFLADGTAAGPEFLVNTTTTNLQSFPKLIPDAPGSVIAWESFQQDGSSFGVYGRRYSVNGTPEGPEFHVNTYTTGAQDGPSIARMQSGRFVVSWRSDLHGGDPAGLFARVYCFPRGDADGDGTLTISDVFYLINSLFAGGPPPVFNSDVDTSGATDIGDVFYVINYLFAGGPQPDCG